MKKILMYALVAGLLGCNAMPRAPAPDVTPLQVTGDYVHEGTKFVFPADNAGFHRVSLVQRGQDASRITAGYSGGPAQCLTVVTLYIDPVAAGERVEDTFARASADALRAHPSAILETEEERNDTTYPGKRAIFVDGDKRVEVGMLRVKGEWDVTHRAVYPVQCAAQARDLLANFLPGWPR